MCSEVPFCTTPISLFFGQAVSISTSFWTCRQKFLGSIFHFEFFEVITIYLSNKLSSGTWLKCKLPFLTQLTIRYSVLASWIRNWVPKIGSCKFFGRPNFQGGSQYTPISTINIYKFTRIRHDIIKQCHGNNKVMKKFNYKLEIEVFRNSTQKNWVS